MQEDYLQGRQIQGKRENMGVQHVGLGFTVEGFRVRDMQVILANIPIQPPYMSVSPLLCGPKTLNTSSA